MFGLQVPDLLSNVTVSQGSLHKKRNQFCCANMCKNALFSLFVSCLMLYNFGTAHAENTEIAQNDNITNADQLGSSINKYASVDDTFDLLQDGEKFLHLDENKNIILVLGNTGSGKTTLTQFIAGDNSKLRSVEVEAETGEYIIEDENEKIGHGIYSKTVIPERVLDATTGVAYYDCPGFSDTRNAAYDIASNYFLKKTVDHVRRVKMVLTISYSSVRIGVDRTDFMKLVRHTNEFIKDIEKFKDSVALVITKVDNEYFLKKNQLMLVSDDKIIEKIANYIKQVRDSLQERLKFEENPREIQFYTKSIFLIDIFLRTKHGQYVNIVLFRRPNMDGVLSEIPLMQDGKKYIKNIIENNIVFTKKTRDDFGFTVSDNSKNNIIKLVDKINKHLLTDISSASNEIEEVVKLKTRYENFYKTKEEMKMIYEELIKNQEELENCSSRREFVQKFTNFINSLDIKNSRKIFLDILKKYKYLEFLEEVSNENYDAKSSEWTKPLRRIIEYARESMKWYSFLTDLFEKLSRYDMYTYFYNEVIRKNARNKRSVGFVDINKLVKSLKAYEVKYHDEINELDSDLRKQQEINNVFNAVYGNSATFKCLGNALVIKGDFIKFSDINFINPCSKPVKTVKLFALNAVYIDVDLIKIGEKINIFMIAPRWEVIGTRKIILDGAHQGSIPLRAPMGQDGEPGLPGGTAGNFVGVGTEIINPEKLTISANGGNGGKGQNGGEGLPGINGHIRIPSGSLESGLRNIESYRSKGFEKSTTYEDALEFIGYAIGIYHQIEKRHYTVYGTSGTAGQDGGMGGAGGKGGFKGKVLIYGLNNLKKISVLSENGSDGSAGRGGAGGKGGRDGSTCDVYHETKKSYWFGGRLKTTDRNWRLNRCYSAWENSPGRTYTTISYQNIKNPDDVNTFIIHYPVNEYKSYLLRNINNSVKDHLLMKFYFELSNDSAIGDSYDSIGLYHELKMLENHFYNLQNTVEIQDLYDSLIKRIDKYSKSPKRYEVTLSHKNFLNTLHAATLSKILNLKNDPRYDLVVDVNSFFTLITNNIDKIRHNAKQTAIAEFNKNYKRKIDEKIGEAEDFIKKLIIPNLEEDELHIGYEFDKLIDEILKLQNSSEINRNELIEKQKALEQSIRTKGLFSALKLFEVVTKFVGPVGEAFSEVIESTNKVTNILTSSQSVIPKVLLPDGVGSLLEEGMTFLENFVRKKARALSHFMDRIFQEVQKYPNELEEISTVVSDLKSNLTNAEENQTDFNLSLITSITDRIIEALTSKAETIRSNSSEVYDSKNHEDKSIDNISDTLDVLVNTAKIVEIFTDDYIRNKDDRAKLKQIIIAIQQQELAAEALRKYQLDIYQTVFPLMKVIREDLTKFTNEASSNSGVVMNILHREISSSLKDIKMILRKITNGFKVQDSIQRFIDKMEETLTLFMKIYEKVDRYNELKELADYIADINSASANQIKTSNNTINSALNDLDLMINYNIVIEQFQKAIYSFKQFVFPFSSHYLQDFDLHIIVDPETNLQNLVSSANNQIKELNSKLTEHNLSVQKHIDMYIYEEYFQTGEKYSGPFFVWGGDEYETTISKLLSGEEVVLKSDILTSVHEKNAIKFNKIEINFNSGDKELLHDLMQRLEYFDVSMKHSGSSYYRCDNSFYLIESDSQNIYYSFEKNAQGEPVRKNNVYTKTKTGQYMLSPYTVWTIQLKHVKNFTVNTLQEFTGKVDLELVGHGQFVSAESSICSTDLKQFYEPVDTISVTDILNEKV